MTSTATSHRRFLPVVLPVCLVATALCPCVSPPRAAEGLPSVETSPPEPVTLIGHGRVVFALERDGRPHFVIYAQGKLRSKLSLRTSPSLGWIWSGDVEHVPPDGGSQRYEVSFSSEAPERIVLNGKMFPIPKQRVDESQELLRGPWFVLTSYGRAVPTGRYFALPNTGDLDPAETNSHAWYFDRDLHGAEVRRNSLEMDDLEGWVVAWDQQHCIQHSDNSRVARLRLFPNGRIVTNRTHSMPLTERRTAPAEVQLLVDRLLKMARQHARSQSDKPPPSAAVGTPRRPFPRALGRGLWDQHQDLVRIKDEDQLHTLRVVHPGRNDRVGRVPEGWDDMRDRLWKFLNTASGDKGVWQDGDVNRRSNAS